MHFFNTHDDTFMIVFVFSFIFLFIFIFILMFIFMFMFMLVCIAIDIDSLWLLCVSNKRQTSWMLFFALFWRYRSFLDGQTERQNNRPIATIANRTAIDLKIHSVDVLKNKEELQY